MSENSPSLTPPDSASAYDQFAWFFNRYWGNSFSKDARIVLERRLLPHLPSDARILDLCCGTGQLSHWLTGCGFRVAGLDRSVEMLRFARDNAPAARFLAADACVFHMPPTHDAVVSTFDSLNHIPSRQDLGQVFRNVYAALRPDGLFLFDMNMDAGFRASSPETTAIVRRDHTCILESKYDASKGVGTSAITLFRRRKDCWIRSDLKILEYLYPEEEVRDLLQQAGFSQVAVYDAERDVGMLRGTGRLFFLAAKRALPAGSAR
jgi:SAM-dependent methyltransferase